MTHLPLIVYRLVQRTMPIACVDVLPYRRIAHELEVGLIRRVSTESRELVWGLVGGRVRRAETLEEAVVRHVSGTLGNAIEWPLPEVGRPALVAEYAPHPRGRQLRDRRQHAIALTYAVEVAGEPAPTGEAAEFRWFTPDARPAERDMVPGHSHVVQGLLEQGLSTA